MTDAIARAQINLALRSIADGDPNGTGPTGEALSDRRGNDQRSSGVRIMRYGVTSREYGVN